MEHRPLGRTGHQTSVIGLGCWQYGGDWGDVSDEDARSTLRAAIDAGVTLLDTADVYGDGRSEQLVGSVVADMPEADRPLVATKVGRRADPSTVEQYTPENLAAWVARSAANLRTERLDLVQLHCPPPAVYEDDAVFEALDAMVASGSIAAYGMSVETQDEALASIARPNVASVQVIVNVFRRKPLERVLPAALAAGVAILARVPLASGLLSGRYDESTTFPDGDHRTYNREGAAFDVGETFSGVPFDVGVAAAREVAAVASARGAATSALALRWLLDQDGVTVAIPGARNAEQALGNAAAADLDRLDDAELSELERVYDDRLRALVHDRW